MLAPMFVYQDPEMNARGYYAVFVDFYIYDSILELLIDQPMQKTGLIALNGLLAGFIFLSNFELTSFYYYVGLFQLLASLIVSYADMVQVIYSMFNVYLAFNGQLNGVKKDKSYYLKFTKPKDM